MKHVATYQKNLSLIKHRWPEVGTELELARLPESVELVVNTPDATLRIKGIHLTSTYDRRREAERQAGLIPLQSPLAWVYGIGLGDLARSLLDRNELRQLNIVILNPSVAVAALTYFDHSDWLNDPRVLLHSGDEAKLAAPLAANPACLILADARSASLRDRVFLELATPFIRRQHSSENSEIQDRIAANERFIKNDGDVGSLFGKKLGATIMVAAAGPSLTHSLSQILHHRAQFPLLAVNSALKPLAQAGIVPDAVMAIDSDPKIISCFEGVDLLLFENVPLIYFPRVPEAVLAIWPGPRLVAFSEHPTYEAISKIYPRGKLFSSGSVIHPTVDLAVRMGATTVILFGADLALPGGIEYAEGAGWEKIAATGTQHWVADGHGNPINTTAALRGYLRDLEDYIKTKPSVRFFNSSQDGALIKGTELWK
jgi:hypothetical protein